MPEGPELHLSSHFVNQTCKDRLFTGRILKSAVSRQPEIEWDEDQYTISAVSRGKELKLTLRSVLSQDSKKKIKGKKGVKDQFKSLDIIFQFGMSGKFDFYEASELQKHAHLNFFTESKSDEQTKMVLSFVDYRRFGKWQPGSNWSLERGPCVLTEYIPFRENVLQNLQLSVFNKPVCEVLLNQKFFNGIGNYLRAELCYRAGIPPFQDARSVFEPLVKDQQEVKVKSENPDILQLCHLLPNEVINLGGTGYDPENRDPDYSKFTEWLQCYYKPDMKNIADHNKRTMWYHGNLGPLAPKEKKERNVKRRKKKSDDKGDAKKIKVEKNENEVKPEKSHKKAKSKMATDRPITRQDIKEISVEKKAGKKRSNKKVKENENIAKAKKSEATKTKTNDHNPNNQSINKRVLKSRSKQRAVSQNRRRTRAATGNQ